MSHDVLVVVIPGVGGVDDLLQAVAWLIKHSRVWLLYVIHVDVLLLAAVMWRYRRPR